MSRGNDIQRQLLEALHRRDPRMEVTWNDEGNIITHLSGTLSEPRDERPEQVAWDFLRENRELFGIENIEEELASMQTKTDQYGWHHVAFQQRYQRLPVWGAMVLTHVDDRRVVQVVDSKYLHRIQVDPTPAIDPRRAIEISWEHAGVEERIEPREAPYAVIFVYEGVTHLAWALTIPGSDLSLDGNVREPAYWQYFIDAHDGAVIARYNMVRMHTSTTGTGLSVNNPPHLKETGKTIQTYHDDSKNIYQLRDTTRQTADKVDILTYDADGALAEKYGQFAFVASGDLSQDSDNNWNDKTDWNSTDHNKRIQYQPAEVDAHDYMGRVYDHYKTRFGRISLDDNGMAIKTYVHVRTQNVNGVTVAYNNSFWFTDGCCFGFGDGDCVGLTFYSGALDIVAHEFTHGVTAHEIRDAQGKPFGFASSGEPAAVEESFSDVFAAFVDRDWWHGDKIVVGSLTAPGKQWRDLSNPTRGLAYDPSDTANQFLAKGVPQPDHYGARYQGTWDNGGAHINCGILNFAAYLATHGGVSQRAGRVPFEIPVYRSDRQGIGWERAEQIYYLALTGYFSSTNSGFLDARQALLDACKQLKGKHDIDQCDWKILRCAFYAVGVIPQGEHYGPDPMIIPWGAWTGEAPPFRSPDIWVEDQAGKEINAVKGAVNTLVAQVHNVGDQAANGVKVRLSYAPFGMGYQHGDFLLIAENSVDLVAGETKKVKVGWDLTNTSEDNTGKWPYTIDTFEHFCVQVEIIGTEVNDTNTCNNMAQTNFVDVATTKRAKVKRKFLVVNPFEDLQTDAKLDVETTLPPSWNVRLGRLPRTRDGYILSLKPGEKLLVQCDIEVPDGPLIQPPINGHLVGSLRDVASSEIEGRLDDAVYSGEGFTFQGKFTGTIKADQSGEFRGEIEGRVENRETGEFVAGVKLTVIEQSTRQPFNLSGTLLGKLTPERRVSISERINDKLVGGVDINLLNKARTRVP
jgi:bacillolysin